MEINSQANADGAGAASNLVGQRRFVLPVLGILLGVVCLAGCTSLPKTSPEWSERRTLDTENTSWARSLAQSMAEYPGLSGVQLLPHGLDALSARLAVADTAERCLDVQYYIWRPDDAGRLLAERLVRAADRGVQVRLLLDDIGGSASDEVLLALDTHTNLEVRLFNPIANRSHRTLSVLFDFQRVNRRMHNKSFTADRLVTIVGGRNVADHYYASGDEPQFADFDVLAAGPAAGDVATMFDQYWYHPSSIPISALIREPIHPDRRAELYASLARHVQTITNSTDFRVLAGDDMGVRIRRHEPDLVWGPTRLVSDRPEKITTDPKDTSTHLLPELRALVSDPKSELLIVSPYFVPGTKGVDFFRSLRKRGVRVVVLSNSLAANDVTAVHAGYRRYRKALLLAGVEMWEIKPDARVRATAGEDNRKRERFSSRSSLHAKAFVYDRQTLFVGSLNLDPRSVSLNTEIGLVVQIPELAAPAVDRLEARLAENAYRLEFVPGPGPCKECGSIVWHSQENGRKVRYTREPHAPFSRRLMVWLLSFLPIESQL
jgi:putative cardiolipin synthase